VAKTPDHLRLVCQKGGRAGPFTAHSQQVSLLRRQGFENPNPRVHFINDLSSLVQQYHKSNADILVMGDFNEVIGLDLNGMAKALRKGHITDLQTYCHGINCEESTYCRGPNRVDYIFSSDRLLPHIHCQGCEPFNARIFSDHRGIFVNTAYPGIFDRSPNIMNK
jgi:endonuclease/exonuclease/phosphatase family metal-dependent hydrolase